MATKRYISPFPDDQTELNPPYPGATTQPVDEMNPVRKKITYPTPDDGSKDSPPKDPTATTSTTLAADDTTRVPDTTTDANTDPTLSTEPVAAQTQSVKGYDREKVKQGIKSLKPGDSISEYLANHPDFADGVKIDGEMLTLPDGETFDVYGDYQGTNTPWWGSEKDWQEEEKQREAAGIYPQTTQTTTAQPKTKTTNDEPTYKYPTLTDDWKKSFDVSSNAQTAQAQDQTKSQNESTLAGQLAQQMLSQDTTQQATTNTVNPDATTNTTTDTATTNTDDGVMQQPIHSDEDPAQGGPTADEQMMHNEILRLLAQGNEPVTEASVSSQYQPVANQYQRSAEETKRAAAERAAFQGTSVGGAGGALDAENNSINEDLAGKKANTMANLVGSELQARRQDVVNALTFAQGEEKNKLTLQLAEIDRKLRERGLDLQNKQIDVNKYLAERGLDLQKYGIDINKVLAERGLDLQKLGLDRQNQQFYDRLAYDIAHDNLSVDDIIQRLISGR